VRTAVPIRRIPSVGKIGAKRTMIETGFAAPAGEFDCRRRARFLLDGPDTSVGARGIFPSAGRYREGCHRWGRCERSSMNIRESNGRCRSRIGSGSARVSMLSDKTVEMRGSFADLCAQELPMSQRHRPG